MLRNGFIREAVKSSRQGVLFDLSIPLFRVILAKPISERGEFFPT